MHDGHYVPLDCRWFLAQTDKVSEFPALEGERYRSIRAKQPTDKITTAEGQSSQREPVYHILEMEGASGHQREAATRSLSATPSRIPVRVERRDAEACGQRGEIATTTEELETWPRAPITGEGGCFDCLHLAPLGSAAILMRDGTWCCYFSWHGVFFRVMYSF